MKTASQQLSTLLIGLSLLLSTGAAGRAADKEALQHFSVQPPDWRTEVMALPPAFAPDFAHRGRLELLFMPGMFKPQQEDFFSYAFVWMIDGEQPGRAQLQRDLTQYFQGLQGAVSQGQLNQAVRAEVQPPAVAGAPQRARVRWTEPFVTKKEQELKLLITPGQCPQGTSLLIQVSPQAYTHPIWRALDQVRAKC